MKDKILKLAKVKSEAEFYKQFPTEEAFLAKYGGQFKKLLKAEGGIGMFADETDQPLQLEKWMTKDKNFMPSSQSKEFDMGSLNQYADIPGKLIQGIQNINSERKKRKSAEQWADVSDVVLQAAKTKDEIPERKYVRPEDVINTGEEFFPIYGVGTNVLKHGGEIQNTYTPNTLYNDLEYVPIKAENGMPIDPWSMGSGIANNLITGIGGENEGGNLGSTLGGTAGTLVGGPVGGAIGGVAGNLLGRALDPNPKRTKAAQQHFDNNMRKLSFTDSIHDNYAGFMRTGGNIRQNESNEYNQIGDLKTHWGGYIKPESYNKFSDGDGITYNAYGNSHEEKDSKGRTGIGLSIEDGYSPITIAERGGTLYGGKADVEMENNEPITTSGDSKIIWGNLLHSKQLAELTNTPQYANMKYKNIINKKIVPGENKQNKILKKAEELTEQADNTSLGKLLLSTAKAMTIGANMNLKRYEEEKEILKETQQAINKTAEENGLSAEHLSKGKIKKALNGTDEVKVPTVGRRPLEVPQDGLEYVNEDDYNKLMQMYEIAKRDKTGKAVEDFQRVFSEKLPNRARNVLEKYPVTSYGKQKGYSPTNLASNIDSIFGKRTEQYLPEIQAAYSPQVRTAPEINVPDVDGLFRIDDTLDINNRQVSKTNGNDKFDFMNVLSNVIPYLRPSDAEHLDPRQLAGEMYAMSHNQVEPVYAQTIQPDLSVPYDISYQDLLNANQNDYRAISKMVQNNPAALSELNANKYAANEKVLGEQFRQNQGEKSRVYEKNRDILNQTKLQNLGILDTQQQRQSLAKSNTKAVAQKALESISNKYMQNQLENRTLQTYENLYNYRFDPRFRAVNMNAPAQFNIPTVTEQDATVPSYGLNDYEKMKALITNYETQKKQQGKLYAKKTSKNGSIVKAMK